ncbi:enolase C-terminal domain-like protein [Clostridium beijerinckii]|uniref:Starvation-sensing protein RspA n=1 Tax=Clostridium beijerinckii TaxID=1520 RepID=A0A7X9XNI6_CLOBE|nr:enolase C-terminal domain-like protein [Clostridium beijerinckii]NMF04309.1 starvation-sensing protein RspA [Clostridium beijerinckii]NOW86791.1 mannonate dehydratase [Clostridium beijerinckii]
MPLQITNVKTITTAPEGINLVVVKVETSEPGLYGLGCATFTQRYKAVVTAVEEYLKPFLIGKDPQRIEDIWQTSMVSGYWRNGPVLNNAISGVDMALWDIKGKLANMPLYQLFGGKCREAVPAYIHADAKTIDHAIDLVQDRIDAGWKNIRVQVGGYGGENPNIHKPENCLPGVYYDPKAYMKTMIETFDRLREHFGYDIGLCHDVHERLSPADAMYFAKAMEKYNLLFLEDSLPPEQVQWYEHIRSHCITPLAQGELFNNPHEWMDIVAKRNIDYLRLHVSQVGGITPVRKIIAFCDAYGIRTAWHGPGDVSPIGHAVNTHLNISTPNLGIQEWSCSIRENTYKVFPGTPIVKDGYVYLNDKPGIGVDIDEKEAMKYPCNDNPPSWTLARLPDGTAARP